VKKVQCYLATSQTCTNRFRFANRARFNSNNIGNPESNQFNNAEARESSGIQLKLVVNWIGNELCLIRLGKELNRNWTFFLVNYRQCLRQFKLRSQIKVDKELRIDSFLRRRTILGGLHFCCLPTFCRQILETFMRTGFDGEYWHDARALQGSAWCHFPPLLTPEQAGPWLCQPGFRAFDPSQTQV
jgi:hypothetical protein